jgi:peptidoglycan/LPS O-acetylase OafA/YrhL
MDEHKIDRFYSLDVLRGFAALSVVFWHWGHFFFVGTKPGKYAVAALPLYDWVHALYTDGWLAVDLFFTLSGFVFYWLYSKRIEKNAITPSRFAMLRFSRLYPLHFVTLLLVAVCQALALHATGAFFVYPNNDTKHFLLNLFFASSWGLESGYSFNGPNWSVSVEILLYAIFFACCRVLPRRLITATALSAIGYAVLQDVYEPIGRGVGSFFLGGCVFFAYQKISLRQNRDLVTAGIVMLTILVWVLPATPIYNSVKASLLSWHPVIPLIWRFGVSVNLLMHHLFADRWADLIMFPLAILSLALVETRRGTLGKRIAIIGDISYSSYLLHFPLQLMFFLAATWAGLDRSIFYRPWLMGLFFLVLITICIMSHRYFEMPAQRYFRSSNMLKRLVSRTLSNNE